MKVNEFVFSAISSTHGGFLTFLRRFEYRFLAAPFRF